ncbi:MAG: hypothetical protein M3Y55_01445 [Pseudomonadota bacterium]|nr:hypothetical protein [Pseudomonadota bacterium]
MASFRTFCLALFFFAAGPFASAADAAAKWGINKDAMTMQECRDRLALPVKDRPKSDEPEVNKDRMCENMLSVERHRPHRPAAQRPARSASQAQ